jgi:hypothetical protein
MEKNTLKRYNSITLAVIAENLMDLIEKGEARSKHLGKLIFVSQILILRGDYPTDSAWAKKMNLFTDDAATNLFNTALFNKPSQFK